MDLERAVLKVFLELTGVFSPSFFHLSLEMNLMRHLSNEAS